MRFWAFLKALIFLYLYLNLQKDWLKTCEDIASQRLDTIYNILKIYIRYIYYVHGRDGPGRPVHGYCPVPLPALLLGVSSKGFCEVFSAILISKDNKIF